MSYIMTEGGWKRLWYVDAPKRPSFPLSRPPRPEEEKWLDGQHEILLKLHERAREVR